MLWEWRGIANMDFIQLGGSSRVGEMILARERSGFAGEKVWDDHQVVPGFLTQEVSFQLRQLKMLKRPSKKWQNTLKNGLMEHLDEEVLRLLKD
ncbi:hypothetical protein Tco_1110270 [Tanacetum coccineum]|uniref:Uncharacterized protein n=1 Tax=Tanacetum coccineum TaxID=301880 RepID=A0ABQ5IIA6_9ASTR